MKVLDVSFCGGYNNGRKVATYDAVRAQRHDDGKDGGRMSRLIGIDLGTTNSCVADDAVGCGVYEGRYPAGRGGGQAAGGFKPRPHRLFD